MPMNIKLPDELKDDIEKDYILQVFRACVGRGALNAEKIMEFDRIIDRPASERKAAFEAALIDLEKSKDSGPETVVF